MGQNQVSFIERCLYSEGHFSETSLCTNSNLLVGGHIGSEVRVQRDVYHGHVEVAGSFLECRVDGLWCYLQS